MLYITLTKVTFPTSGGAKPISTTARKHGILSNFYMFNSLSRSKNRSPVNKFWEGGPLVRPEVSKQLLAKGISPDQQCSSPHHGLSINVPVLYMARYEVILMRETFILGAL